MYDSHGAPASITVSPGASAGPAVPDRDQLSSLGNVTAPLAPFFLGTLRGSPLAIHAPLVEAHGSGPSIAPHQITPRADRFHLPGA